MLRLLCYWFLAPFGGDSGSSTIKMNLFLVPQKRSLPNAEDSDYVAPTTSSPLTFDTDKDSTLNELAASRVTSSSLYNGSSVCYLNWK